MPIDGVLVTIYAWGMDPFWQEVWEVVFEIQKPGSQLQTLGSILKEGIYSRNCTYWSSRKDAYEGYI